MVIHDDSGGQTVVASVESNDVAWAMFKSVVEGELDEGADLFAGLAMREDLLGVMRTLGCQGGVTLAQVDGRVVVKGFEG